MLREDEVKTEAEIGVMLPHAEGQLGPLEDGERQERILSQWLQREPGPTDTLILDF